MPSDNCGLRHLFTSGEYLCIGTKKSPVRNPRLRKLTNSDVAFTECGTGPKCLPALQEFIQDVWPHCGS